MKKETLSIRTKETTARIRNTAIEAVRTKDIVKKAVRVYDEGKIGIGGAVGDVDERTLEQQATDNLQAGVLYPHSLETGKDHRDLNPSPMDAQTMVQHTENVLNTLRKDFPEFSFSEAITVRETTYTMQNSEGLDLSYHDAAFELGLILKEKKSANLFDGFVVFEGRNFDPKRFWKFNREYLAAYNNPVDFPKGDKIPVFTFQSPEAKRFLMRSLNGENYATNSSLFSGKMGEKLFHEKFTLEQNRNPKESRTAFFDNEGVRMSEDRVPLIENGVLKNVFTDKETAKRYNLNHTGAAGGAYDGVPSLSTAPLRIKTDSKDIKKALKGQPAIFVVVSSGGDFTADGTFAAPVQLAFLFDGEKLLGKLEEFTMRSTIYKMYGEDYIGTFNPDTIYIGDDLQIQGYYMDIKR